MAKAVTLEEVYDKLSEMKKEMVTKHQIEEFLETIEILSNPETMSSIKASEEDIKAGRIKRVSSVKDMLEEPE